MTRLKELRRIESAIDHQNLEELEWAKNYCKSRLSYAQRKDHIKAWQKRLDEITKAMETDE